MERLMAARDLLLPLISYPLPLSPEAIERAVRLARGLSEAHGPEGRFPEIATRVTGLVYEIELEAGLYFEGADFGSFLDQESRKSKLNADRLAETFEAAATRHNVRHVCQRERRTMDAAARHLVDEARLHQATILPMRRDDINQQDLAVRLLFGTGRPMLIGPESPTRQPASAFRTVAVAWDGSRAATRAVADAMPFLRRADAVRIFTATDDKPAAAEARAGDLAAHLALQGVDASVDAIRKTDAHSIGSFMESYVAAHQVDLLVMGAYGHSRLREFLLGGATRAILMNPPCWVLLSH
jgi:nucleotide-binding universal stress UspA family protein